MQTGVCNLLSRAVLWTMAMIMLTGGFTGCSYLPFMKSDKSQVKRVKTLWQSGEQYVAIEKQDRQPGGIEKANEHISEISVDRLRSAFASIDFRPAEADKSRAMFNDDELRILSEYVAEGLALAGPDEDVTFVVIGHHVAALGFLKQRMVTTGRVFCQDGQINIIFGDVHRELTETMGVPEDRRLNPFLPGSREGNPEKKLGGILIPKKDGEIFAKMREDWLIFPLKAETVSVPTAAQEGGEGAEVSKTAPAATGKENAQVPEVRSSAPAASREKTAPAAKKSVEERLIILNELRNKKLINEDEYRVKRLDILNDL